MIYELYEFDGVKLPLYNPRQSPDAGQTDNTLLAVAGGGVYDRQGADQLLPRSRSLRVRGVYDFDTVYLTDEDGAYLVDENDDYIIAGDGPAVVSAHLDALTGRQGKIGQLWRRPFRDMSARQWVTARLVSCTPSNRNLGVQSVEVEARFLSSMSAWRSESPTVTTAASAGGNVTLRPAVYGSTVVRDAVLEIAATGAISTLTVWGGPVGEVVAWTWSGSIYAGQTLTVDCSALSVAIDGLSAYSGLTLAAEHSARGWLALGLSSEPIGFVADGAYTATITHYDQWT